VCWDFSRTNAKHPNLSSNLASSTNLSASSSSERYRFQIYILIAVLSPSDPLPEYPHLIFFYGFFNFFHLPALQHAATFFHDSIDERKASLGSDW
jgi:hypothetical protein